MTKLLNSVESKFYSIPENVALARVMVASIAAPLDLLLSQLDEIKVAVSEAVSNAIIHGYQGKNEGIIVYNIQHWQDKLVITVQDSGIGIANIEEAMEPSFSSQENRMGLGFAFMHSFMDKVEVLSEVNHGTTVVLTKMLPQEAKADGETPNDYIDVKEG